MTATSFLVVLIPLAIAMAALAVPLTGRKSLDGAADSTVAILKDQLGELERDQRRGLIGETEAKAARLEVERRILKAASRTAPQSFQATALGRALVILAILAVPVGSTLLYLRLGTPTMSDMPLASRELDRAPTIAPQEILDMVAGLEARLEANPDDVQGWLMLGRSTLTLERTEDAIAAYRRARELAPEEPEAITGLAEALLARSLGVVTPEVRQLMFRLAELQPGDPRPPFYMGLADAQAGDYNAALERWRVLLEASPADAPWRAQIEPSIRQAAGQLGIDPEPILALAAPPTPQEERARTLAALDPEERTAEIRGMVQGLADRLAAEGGAPEDWQRLGRSYLIIGDRDGAARAFRQALVEAPDDPVLNKDLATALLEAPDEPEGLPTIPDEAVAHLEKALAQSPEDPELHWYLGIRALADGNPEETREHWQKVLANLDPATPEHALVQSQLDRLQVN
jgi:cytochrome c-type biogenesis protein CcmH